MHKNSIQIIQVTDTHLYANENTELLGRNTSKSLLAVVKLIKLKFPKPDLILLTGDLSQDGSQESYLRMAKALKNFTCPIYYLPGNHDCVSTMNSVFSHTHVKTTKKIIIGNWGIQILDSVIDGKVSGLINQEEMTQLKQNVQQWHNKYFLICLHHHPILIGSTWLDQIGLKNRQEFMQTIQVYLNIRLVVCGHVHQAFEKKQGHVTVLSSPSTCVQFKPHTDEFTLDRLNPGFRSINLLNDGQFKTNVHRVKGYYNNINYEAKGY